MFLYVYSSSLCRTHLSLKSFLKGYVLYISISTVLGTNILNSADVP